MAGTLSMLAAACGAPPGAESPDPVTRTPETQRLPKQLRLWVFGDAHVGTDLKQRRRSLAEAIAQSEGPNGFEWDVAIQLGDLSGAHASPTDEEGREVVDQYAAAKRHRREQIYDLAGNHDASGPDELTQWWFKKWIDPMGESTRFSGVDGARRPYPVSGTWERYSFQVGNLLFLIMSDRNDGGPPVGRGKEGGYPSGAVTTETFEWWKQNVEANRDAVIVSAHHHMLRETTVGSGDWEGYTQQPDGTYVRRYHRYFPDGGPEGASYLYYVGGVPKAQAFEKYLDAHPGAIDLWLGAHTHAHPDEVINGRSHIERRWGATFVNCAQLTRYHAMVPAIPMSRLFTFTQDSDRVRVQCYLHTDDLAPSGWYAKVERTIHLGKPFRFA
jgi:hypothetical protein